MTAPAKTAPMREDVTQAYEVWCRTLPGEFYEPSMHEAFQAGYTAHPAAPQGEELGIFADWDVATLAAQCRMQARDNLDPEYTQFMHAVAAALAPATIASRREGA